MLRVGFSLNKEFCTDGIDLGVQAWMEIFYKEHLVDEWILVFNNALLEVSGRIVDIIRIAQIT